MDTEPIPSIETEVKLPQTYSPYYTALERAQYFGKDEQSGRTDSLIINNQRIPFSCYTPEGERPVNFNHPIDQSFAVNVGLFMATTHQQGNYSASQTELALAGITDPQLNTYGKIAHEIKAWQKTNKQKSGYSPSDYLPKAIRVGNLYLEWDELNEWASSMVKESVPISIRTILTLTEGNSTGFDFIKLGKNYQNEGDWTHEATVTREVLRMWFLLKVPLPKHVRIFEISDMEGPSETRNYLRSKHTISTGVGGFLSPVEKNDVIVFTRARPIINGNQAHVLEIDSKEYMLTAKHELAHMVDPYISRPGRNISAREGFATAAALDFDIATIRDLIRRHSSRDITLGKLEQVLTPVGQTSSTDKNSQRGVTAAERYLVSASFFAFIFKETGREMFRSLYDGLYKEGGFSTLFENFCRKHELSSTCLLQKYFLLMNNRGTSQ